MKTVLLSVLIAGGLAFAPLAPAADADDMKKDTMSKDSTKKDDAVKKDTMSKDRPQTPAARLRLPDEDPHSHQARLQEPEIRSGNGSYQHRQGRLLGEPKLQLVQRAVVASLAKPVAAL